MNLICSEHKVEMELIRIEHNMINDGYFYTLSYRPTLERTFISSLYPTDIEARAAAFKHVGVMV